MPHLLEHFEPWDEKVKDHCHHTEKYRGAAHQKCNLQYTVLHYIPIVFHNPSGYDVHLFIRELGKKFDSGSIGIIAENKEKYISFTVNITAYKHETPSGKMKQITRQLRFIDSVRYVASSLNSLSLGIWLG